MNAERVDLREFVEGDTVWVRGSVNVIPTLLLQCRRLVCWHSPAFSPRRCAKKQHVRHLRPSCNRAARLQCKSCVRTLRGTVYASSSIRSPRPVSLCAYVCAVCKCVRMCILARACVGAFVRACTHTHACVGPHERITPFFKQG